MRKLYAFLIGINEYNHPSIKNLQGCVNDVQNMVSILKSDCFKELEPEITVLVNEQATHQNIIQTFRSTLRDKVKPGDVAFFHYSGHGSRQISAPEFRQFFAEQFDETMVCFGSRQPGGYDLADKELAVLINETVNQGATMTVLLDCCHSGSGTRSDEATKSGCITRQAGDNLEPRLLESYIDGWYLQQKAANNFKIPRSKHILLAACDRRELAKESPNKTGLFTETLYELLKESPKISYSELFTKLRKKIVRLDILQTPQIEPYEGFNPYTAFISGEKISEEPTCKAFYNPGLSKWVVNMGAFQGLSTAPEKPAKFAMYEGAEAEANLRGYLETSQVQPDCAYLEVPPFSEYDPKKEYLAKLVSLPEHSLQVKVTGNTEKIELFTSRCPADFRTEFSDQLDAAKYEINIADNEMSLFTNYPSRILIQKATGSYVDCTIHLIKLLDKIKKWEQVVQIHNKDTRIKNDQIEFSVFDENDNILTPIGETYNFLYTGDDIKLRLKAKNNTSTDLYFNLFCFTDHFGIVPVTNSLPAPAQSDYMLLYGGNDEEVYYLPDEKDSSLDTLRLFVSSKPIDGFIITQKEIENFGKTIICASRSMGGLRSKPRIKPDDWMVKHLEIFLHS